MAISVATYDRAILHLATQPLVDWNDLVWYHLVCRVTRVLDRVSDSLLIHCDER